VIFALRDEFARTLEDIVFRRMMIGFDADQGRPMYDEITALAAAEAGWSREQTMQQLKDLNGYADSLRVG
jgi:glycerol-3-phosphate dehydrogenase